MQSPNDPTLETDHLDELLETSAPSQPVVVVQYRNRGVSTWVVFPFVIVVTAASLFAYHRMVVEKDRIQAARDRSLLALKIEAERALVPITRDNPAATTVLPVPSGLAQQPAPDGASGPASSLGKEAEKALPSASGAKPEPGASSTIIASSTSASGTSASKPPVATSPAITPPKAANAADVAASDLKLAQENKGTADTQPTVDDPFAALDNPPKSLTPNETVGPTAGLDQKDEKAPGPAKAVNKGQLLQISPEPSPPVAANTAPAISDPRAASPAPTVARGANVRAGEPDPAVASRAGRIEPVPLTPLPTKEETQRAIEEEANRKAAEHDARFENRDADLRARRFAEQLKFREELRELLRSQGNHAGPDISKLDKQYDYDVDQDRYDRAVQIWRFSRMPVTDKVKYLRSLDVPETKILEFMCSSFDKRIRTRGGPRDQNEVWVWAAKQLLSCEFPRSPAGQRGSNGSAEVAAPVRKAVVSTPR